MLALLLVRRWHPDKFLQKLGHRLSEEEKEEVEFEHLRLESVLSFLSLLKHK